MIPMSESFTGTPTIERDPDAPPQTGGTCTRTHRGPCLRRSRTGSGRWSEMEPLRQDPNMSITPAQQDSRVLDLPRPQISYGYTSVPMHQPGLLAELWRVFNKRRWAILATMFVVFTLTTLYTFRTTPLYEAAARIAISKE